jgi:hypothetical protein
MGIPKLSGNKHRRLRSLSFFYQLPLSLSEPCSSKVAPSGLPDVNAPSNIHPQIFQQPDIYARSTEIR